VPHAKLDDVARQIVSDDQAFAPLVAQVGSAPVQRVRPPRERFPALVSAVVSQLLSTKAADTIHSRVVNECDGVVTADAILHIGPDRLRSAGLSNAKAATVQTLARRTVDGTLRLDQHARWDDAAITDELMSVRGVGPWTIQVYLLFTLGRPDVWPVGDLGVRRGWSLIHSDPELISAKQLQHAGDPHAGRRSAVAWYCWQAVHLERGF